MCATYVSGGDSGADRSALRAWLYDVDRNGTSRPSWNGDWSSPDRFFEKVVPSSATLRICVDVRRDTASERYLRAPKAEGMAGEPVAVSPDPDTGHWIIRNRGRTNPLRVQPYGLDSTPLRPGGLMSMPGENVAVWIPVGPRGAEANDRRETFRLLILRAREPGPAPGPTKEITRTRTRALTRAMCEAIIVVFGEYLSWPPLPIPHVRKESEVRAIGEAHGMLAARGDNWPRNRVEVLSGRDGLFVNPDSYLPLGGDARTPSNYLAAFHRLVQLGSITSDKVMQWADNYGLEPYLRIDKNLLR
jgi:hypothetical protein